MQYDLSTLLTGKILISSPAIPDNRFYKSVILITNRGSDVTTGIVLNKISAHKFSHIIKNIDSNIDEKSIDLGDQQVNVVLGGPLKNNNLFIIHSNDYKGKESIPINNSLSFTNQSKVIYEISKNNGPKHSIISIGCAAWNQNQLEYELLANNWFILDAEEVPVFDIPFVDLYDECFKRIGFTNNENNPALFLGQTYKC